MIKDRCWTCGDSELLIGMSSFQIILIEIDGLKSQHLFPMGLFGITLIKSKRTHNIKKNISTQKQVTNINIFSIQVSDSQH